MDYLLTRRNHPTADEVYCGLLSEIPTLSKTTVYNTMKLFVHHGVALQLDVDEKNARFDGIVDAHAHFYCKKCGCIHDLPLERNFLPSTMDFVIDEAHVTFKGLCANCKQRIAN
jgi:Fur family peroxide stress response transcriptional regulator